MGSKYTWVKYANLLNPLMLRLDRALVDMDWRFMFPEGFVTHLPRIIWDHAPVLVSLFSKHISGPNLKPFQFQATCFTNPRCDLVVGQSWEWYEGGLL